MLRSYDVAELDLGAYLRRIGCADLTEQAEPTADLLRRVHRGHSESIPFENLGILLGEGAPLEIGDLQKKMVAGGRGGYCGEHNLLLAAALERLGFEVDRRQARMQVGPGQPRTHAALLVQAGGETYLADVGLGVDGRIEPLVLEAGTHPDADEWVHVLTRRPNGWELAVRGQDGREIALYRLCDEPALPLDFEVANHWTSTHPDSPFVTNLVVHQRVAGQRRALARTTLTDRSMTGPDRVTQLGPGDLSRAVIETFGIPLTDAEVRTLQS